MAKTESEPPQKKFSWPYANRHVFLMSFPAYIENRIANNILMKKYLTQPYNYKLAFDQWTNLYREISHNSIVYLLPPVEGFQDQTFVANLTVRLPHINNPTLILSNFRSEPRKGEELAAYGFLSSIGYDIIKSPYHFEGEADLKMMRENLYVGGYGIRTDIKTHDWLEETFAAKIISVKMNYPENYHFDCSFLPLNPGKALVAVKTINKCDLKKMEKFMEIVEVPEEYIFDGWTNSLIIGSNFLYSYKPSSEKLCEIIKKQGFTPKEIYLEEFLKSGGDLSCLVCKLN